VHEEPAARDVPEDAVEPETAVEPGSAEDGEVTLASMMVGDREYRYGMWMPRGLETPAPCLVFLHGMGECGTDGRKQMTVGLVPAVERNPERWPFVVIAPQKPDAMSAWEDHDVAVLTILDALIERGVVDGNRVALTGLSQGGHGTIVIGARYAARFRAAVPVCGYIAPEWSAGGVRSWTAEDHPLIAGYAESLSAMPMWLAHGALDSVVPMRESELLVKALYAAGASPKFTVVREAGHNSWDAMYGDSEVAAWLVEQTLGDGRE
jgi:predicted peptidase